MVEETEELNLIEKQLKQHKQNIFTTANEVIHQERVAGETQTEFWRTVVPGETVFPWTHGEECERH